MPRAIALLVALMGAAVWVLLAVIPPAPKPAAAPAELFSATRAQIDIREIGQAPHPAGSAESDRVRAYLAQRLRVLGAIVSEQ
ncbi:MAG: peptidase, partial [Rhizorhabdus sp.]|nr:peptidase [Rhizorhabdus sp.]